ncbi:MAG: hypothetical protein ACRDH8_04010 [Actinomycetota bacterium]
MPQLAPMPPIRVAQADLVRFGKMWTERGGSLSRTPPESSGELGQLFDRAVGEAVAVMLGDIPMAVPSGNDLLPANPNCVEVGPVKIVGAVRPQRYDVGYRPDGPRLVFDSKTLNDTDSVQKNFLNMVNDLATEATTIHSRFPYTLVAFMFIVPRPCLDALPKKSAAAIDTLDRLARRVAINDPNHLAEAIAVVVWDPATGLVDPDIPVPGTRLRLERFSEQIDGTYVARYEGLPPHERLSLPGVPSAQILNEEEE